MAEGLGGATGQATLRLNLEGHGRERLAGLATPLDVSRTVGWFTSLYPVRLPVTGTPGAALGAVKETLRGVPHHGLSYGVLRYLSAAPGALAAQPPAPLCVNYLGQVDQTVQAERLWGPAEESPGPSESAAAPRRYGLELTAVIAGGQLHLQWRYDGARYGAATVTTWATAVTAALTGLITHCQTAPASEMPPASLTSLTSDQNRRPKTSARSRARLVRRFPRTDRAHVRRGVRAHQSNHHSRRRTRGLVSTSCGLRLLMSVSPIPVSVLPEPQPHIVSTGTAVPDTTYKQDLIGDLLGVAERVGRRFFRGSGIDRGIYTSSSRARATFPSKKSIATPDQAPAGEPRIGSAGDRAMPVTGRSVTERRRLALLRHLDRADDAGPERDVRAAPQFSPRPATASTWSAWAAMRL